MKKSKNEILKTPPQNIRLESTTLDNNAIKIAE